MNVVTNALLLLTYYLILDFF